MYITITIKSKSCTTGIIDFPFDTIVKSKEIKR